MYSAYQAEFIYFFFSGVFGIVSLITPRLLKRYSAANIILTGEIITALGYATVLLINQTTELWILLTPLVFVAIGLGFAFPAFNIEMAINLPKKFIGEGSGLFITFGLLFSSIFAVLSASLLNIWLIQKFHVHLAKQAIQATTTQLTAMNTMLAHADITHNLLLKIGMQNPNKVLNIFYSSFMYAMHNLAIIGICLGVAGSLIALLTLKEPAGDSKQ